MTVYIIYEDLDGDIAFRRWRSLSVINFYTAEKPVDRLQASLSTCSAQNIFVFPAKEPIHRITMEASQFPITGPVDEKAKGSWSTVTITLICRLSWTAKIWFTTI